MYEADRAMVARMRAGDQRAFDEFFKATAPRLVAHISRRSPLDAASLEDIVQNALIKAVRNLSSYRGEAALLTWVTEICRHELADAHRKAGRRPVHVSLDEPHMLARVGDSLQAPVSKEPAAHQQALSQHEQIMRVLAGLPANYALALEAKYGDGLSVEAIARELGVTEIAAQSVLARARDLFRQRWLEGSPGD